MTPFQHVAVRRLTTALTRSGVPHSRPLSVSYVARRPQPADAAGAPVRPSMPPDAEFAQSESRPTAAAVDQYLETKLSHPEYAGDASLGRGLERAEEAGMPSISVTAMQGQFLSVLVKMMKAERVLEIGTLGGYSTSFLTKALPPQGRLDTLEFSPEHARIAQQNFIDTDLYPFPTIHIGPALTSLQDPNGPFSRLPGEEEGEKNPGYDLCFVDANKEQYFEYWMECLRLTRKGGVIVLDNAVRGGRIAMEKNDEPRIDVSGLRKVYDWVEGDKGKTVLMSGIQTVGGKSWDGFAIAYKL